MRIPVVLLFWPLAVLAQNPHEQDIQRALIQLDQRSAEFARQLRPYERMKAAEARGELVLRLPPPVVRRELDKPLPLPGGPRAGVDPVTNPGVPN